MKLIQEQLDGQKGCSLPDHGRGKLRASGSAAQPSQGAAQWPEDEVSQPAMHMVTAAT